MNRQSSGFTLIEMLIVVAILGLVLAGTSQMVVSMLKVHRQQSKLAETGVEGVIGLEMLRMDLGKAGYGLPWNGLANYTEAASGMAFPLNLASQLNDAPSGPPRAIVSKNDVGWNNTDYLAVKAVNIAMNSTCNKWAFITPSGASTVWSSLTPTNDNFAANDRVIVLAPGAESTENTARVLQTSGGSFFTTFNNDSSLASALTLTGLVYGVDSVDLAMPFNRADYYVRVPTTGMPQRCASGTGILYKGAVNQNNGNMTEWPLLDCVADMQVVFRYDPMGSGSASLAITNDISTWTAQTIRDQVKEVRVYVLGHEGLKDPTFTYPFSTVYVGGDSFIGSSSGRLFNFATSGIANWQNYRWKVYTLVVKLDNLL